MDSNLYLDNLMSDLQSWSQGDGRDDIKAENTIKSAETPQGLLERDDVKGYVIAFRYGDGVFSVQIGSNKPLEWTPRIEALVFAETTGGKLDRSIKYDRMLELFDMLIDWSNQVDAAADIHDDISDFYAVSHQRTGEDQDKYYAFTITFETNICVQ